jgi:flagellar basal-body rod modification protein FlgD
MTNINQAGGLAFIPTDPNAGKGNVAPKKELSKEDFLKILLVQMKTQNPMKPFDSSTMLQQMGSLTSLTSTEELKKSIGFLNQTIGKSEMLSASQLINKQVHIVSDESPLTEKHNLKGSVIVPSKAGEMTITIKDNNGRVVKTISKGDVDNGVIDFEWDGLDVEGKKMAFGTYKISATGTLNGKKEDLMTAGCYEVRSVAMNPATGSVFLNFDGKNGIDMGYIVKVI